jgi:hypothetical protein
MSVESSAPCHFANVCFLGAIFSSSELFFFVSSFSFCFRNYFALISCCQLFAGAQGNVPERETLDTAPLATCCFSPLFPFLSSVLFDVGGETLKKVLRDAFPPLDPPPIPYPIRQLTRKNTGTRSGLRFSSFDFLDLFCSLYFLQASHFSFYVSIFLSASVNRFDVNDH